MATFNWLKLTAEKEEKRKEKIRGNQCKTGEWVTEKNVFIAALQAIYWMHTVWRVHGGLKEKVWSFFVKMKYGYCYLNAHSVLISCSLDDTCHESASRIAPTTNTASASLFALPDDK